MIIKDIPVGRLETNCYLVGDPETLLVIDPGAEADVILKEIRQNDYKVAYVVLTHCHYDHIDGAAEIVTNTGAKLLIGAKESENYKDRHVTLCGYFQAKSTLLSPDQLLCDGEIFTAGTCSFRVIETPGHTSGSIALLSEDCLFSGDTLFYESIGRSDFPTGNAKLQIESIRDKLFTLPDETKVFPGHGPQTTIGHEKECNQIYLWQCEQLL